MRVCVRAHGGDLCFGALLLDGPKVKGHFLLMLCGICSRGNKHFENQSNYFSVTAAGNGISLKVWNKRAARETETVFCFLLDISVGLRQYTAMKHLCIIQLPAY